MLPPSLHDWVIEKQLAGFMLDIVVRGKWVETGRRRARRTLC